MKITAIRYRRLVSTDRYGHFAVELETQLERSDDYETSFRELRAEVDRQCAGQVERDGLFQDIHQLREEVVRLERQRDDLRDDIKTNREILRGHEQLEALARERGIDPAGLNGEIPF